MKKIKAKRMWAHPRRLIMCKYNYCGDLSRFAVLPIDDEAALVEQAARAIDDDFPAYGSARAVLESLGIIKKGRK